MNPSALNEAFDPWAELAKYRERYDIEDQLGTLHSLERTIDRRRARLRSLQRRAQWLAAELEETDRQVLMLRDEISGSLQTGGLLIRELLDQIRIRVGEAWSPVPVRAYRMWRIEGNSLMGAKTVWRRPTFSAGCLRNVDGEDVPHSVRRCGTPACGIYGLKELYQLAGWEEGAHFEKCAIGVVAFSGKVVEHEAGYRAQNARVLAVVAQLDARSVVTSVGSEIDHLFHDPTAALARYGRDGPLDVEEVARFLEKWKEVHDIWT